jgi:ACS family hexuronate transporter-like MFS transporter
MGDRVPADVGRVAPWKWGVIWLLFLATVINYMDRQTMGVMSGEIRAAFTSENSVAGLTWMFETEPQADGKHHLSEGGYGDIEFAFGITFAISQFVAGYLVDRGSLRWFYAAALLLWSAAGFSTGLATTVEALLICRIVLAIGEGFNWPCAVTAVQRLMPREQRSLANGFFHSGASIGAIVTPLLALAMVKDGVGWQKVFLVVGAGGAVWVLLWLAVLRGERAIVIDRKVDDAGRSTPVDGPEESFWRIFTRRYIWITIGVGIAVNICWHFCRVWVPRYLERDLGLGFKLGADGTGGREVGLLIQSGFYIAADIGSLLAGYLTRRIIHAGWPVERARKAVQLATAALCLLAIPAVVIGKLGHVWLAAALLYVVAAGAMGGFANYFALTQEVSPRNTAQVLGFTGAAAWFAVSAVHPIAGRIADRIGTFVPIFQVIACVPLVGACIGLLWPRTKR